MPKPNWVCEQLHRNSFNLKVPMQANAQWEFWLLLGSDYHWDSKKCNRELLRSHLEQAKERGAAIVCTGDFYDAMGGKFDKRASKSDLRPELKSDNYLDLLGTQAAEWLAPYAHNYCIITEGNHETAIRNRYEIDLTQRLVALTNAQSKSNIFACGYSGWLKLSFIFGFNTKRGGQVRIQSSKLIHFDHGWGGGGQVTHDAIQHQRRSTYLPDADIITSGHSHDFWTKEIARQRLSDKGIPYQDIQTHIKIPSYKNDYGDGAGGWCIERGHAPKALGGYWVRFFYRRDLHEVVYEVIRAG